MSKSKSKPGRKRTKLPVSRLVSSTPPYRLSAAQKLARKRARDRRWHKENYDPAKRKAARLLKLRMEAEARRASALAAEAKAAEERASRLERSSVQAPQSPDRPAPAQEVTQTEPEAKTPKNAQIEQNEPLITKDLPEAPKQSTPPKSAYVINGANLTHSIALYAQERERWGGGDFGTYSEDTGLAWESDRQAQQKAEEAAERKKRFQSGIVGL